MTFIPVLVSLLFAASAYCGSVTTRPGFFTVTGRVVDAETHRPIPQFTVTPGSAGVASDLLPWQVGNKQVGLSGRYSLEVPDRGPFALKVEAPGYLPAMASGYPTDGVAVRDFELHRGDGFSGTVIGPTGTAVEGAQVAYNLKWDALQLDGHKIIPRHWPSNQQVQMQQTPVVITDADGHFAIPGRPGINSLIVFHEAGFAEIPRETLDQTRVIHLQRWTNTVATANAKGLKVSLKPIKMQWPADAIPLLKAEVRNEGRSKLLGSADRLWRIEVDGIWYRFPNASVPMSEITAAQNWTHGLIALDGRWRKVYDALDSAGEAMFGPADAWYSGMSSASLALVPGKHIIRLAVFAVEAGADTVGAIEAVSEPVKIEIR